MSGSTRRRTALAPAQSRTATQTTERSLIMSNVSDTHLSVQRQAPLLPSNSRGAALLSQIERLLADEQWTAAETAVTENHLRNALKEKDIYIASLHSTLQSLEQGRPAYQDLVAFTHEGPGPFGVVACRPTDHVATPRNDLLRLGENSKRVHLKNICHIEQLNQMCTSQKVKLSNQAENIRGLEAKTERLTQHIEVINQEKRHLDLQISRQNAQLKQRVGESSTELRKANSRLTEEKSSLQHRIRHLEERNDVLVERIACLIEETTHLERSMSRYQPDRQGHRDKGPLANRPQPCFDSSVCLLPDPARLSTARPSHEADRTRVKLPPKQATYQSPISQRGTPNPGHDTNDPVNHEGMSSSHSPTRGGRLLSEDVQAAFRKHALIADNNGPAFMLPGLGLSPFSTCRPRKRPFDSSNDDETGSGPPPKRQATLLRYREPSPMSSSSTSPSPSD